MTGTDKKSTCSESPARDISGLESPQNSVDGSRLPAPKQFKASALTLEEASVLWVLGYPIGTDNEGNFTGYLSPLDGDSGR